jgi:RHS repeat-associated protein
VGNPYGFTGREFDPESGLIYLRARYYDPRTGRFHQEDPIQSLNPYRYASNNPLRFTDPFGLLSIGTGIGPTILTDPIAEAGPTALITPRSQDVRTALIDTVPERQTGSFGDPPSEVGGTVLCDKPQSDDHELSRHALDRKRQHGLSNERIRRALDSPEKYPSRTHPNRTVHHDPVTNTTVVTEGNRVVTVRPGKPSNYIK